MYICYIFELDTNGNKKPGSAKLKLPAIPRIGEYVNLSVIKEKEVLTLAGTIKAVDMYCSIEEGDSAFYQDGIPEPKELIWYITLERGEKEFLSDDTAENLYQEDKQCSRG